MNEQSQTAQQLNDAFRANGSSHGTNLIISGVETLGQLAVTEILLLAATFDAFNKDNDPYGEHDFGALEHNGQSIFWKIDCYDHSMRFASPNPADSSITKCVLTIMRAEEY